MAEKRTRPRGRRMPTLQTDHVNMMPPKHPLLSTIQAAISKRQISKHPRGTPLNSILKFVHDHDGVSDENRVVDALEQGTKTGLFRKGKFGWYSSADDPVTRKRKRVDDTKDETRLKEQWARTRINKEESTRTKDNKHDERGLLRQQERIDYSLYMSSSETDDDSDSSLTRMFENVENSSYVKNKDYLNKDRTLRKVHYPDYYYRFGSDSDSDPEFYCRPQPVY